MVQDAAAQSAQMEAESYVRRMHLDETTAYRRQAGDLMSDSEGRQSVMLRIEENLFKADRLVSDGAWPQVANTAAFPYVSAVATGRPVFAACRATAALSLVDDRGVQRIAEYEQAAAAAEQVAREAKVQPSNAGSGAQKSSL